MLRAFSDKRYDYYKLTKSLGFNNSGYGLKQYVLPEGAIFVHDKEDSVKGSIGDGCLKLCWTPDGNTYGWIAGGAMCFHASFKKTDLFELVQKAEDVEKIEKLENFIDDLEKKLKDVREQLKELRQ